MSRAEIEQDVIRCLRKIVLCGSDREIPLHAPLGEMGLGLDSLALVGFVNALEKAFGIAFPDDIWTERGQLTLEYFVNLITASWPRVHHPDVHAIQAPDPPLSEISAVEASSLVKLALVIRKLGWWRGLRWAASRFLLRFLHFFYERETFFILACNLFERNGFTYPSSLNLVFREARPQDTAGLKGLWEPHSEKNMINLFQKRLEAGYICLTAWHEDKIVGIDWILATGDDEPGTGLKLRMGAGVCYGLNLYEHKMYQGKGVGLAVLAFSIAEARKRGYHTQFTFVRAKNAKMLSASTHLFGFKKIGHIHTTRILRQPSSVWHMGERSGRGEILLL